MVKDDYKIYAEALLAATKDVKGEKLNSIIEALVKLLAKKQKLKQAPLIIKEFERLAKKAAGIVNISITSAHKLNQSNLESIKTFFGKNVEETTSLNEALLGGFTVRSEDTIFDASLKTQLTKLKQNLLI